MSSMNYASIFKYSGNRVVVRPCSERELTRKQFWLFCLRIPNDGSVKVKTERATKILEFICSSQDNNTARFDGAVQEGLGILGEGKSSWDLPDRLRSRKIDVC